MDKNSNQSIEREELQAGKPPRAARDHPIRRLWELDADQNGHIAWDEFSQGEFIQKLPPERQQALFHRLDTDQDGFITREDKPKRPQRPAERKPQQSPAHRKSNADRSQGSKPPRLEMFTRLDLNQDESLHFDEFSQAPWCHGLDEDQREAAFERLDRNRDLLISREELIPAKPKNPTNSLRPAKEAGDGASTSGKP